MKARDTQLLVDRLEIIQRERAAADQRLAAVIVETLKVIGPIESADAAYMTLLCSNHPESPAGTAESLLRSDAETARVLLEKHRREAEELVRKQKQEAEDLLVELRVKQAISAAAESDKIKTQPTPPYTAPDSTTQPKP